MRIRLIAIFLLTVSWIGCGGGSSSQTSTTPPATGGGSVAAPTPITVAAGQATSGTNIVVPNSASAFNVTMLGVNSTGATTASASNVGGSVARGTSALILIFGPGLSGTDTLALSGPNDISITGERAVKATDGTPGIEFTITVGGNAAVGARTLNVTQGTNASTFVGGIEVF
jgi:hypothetical protein